MRSGDCVAVMGLDGPRHTRAGGVLETLIGDVLGLGETYGRLDQDLLAVLLPGAAADEAVRRIAAVRDSWHAVVPAGAGLSAGVAVVAEHGGVAALAAADGALGRARAEGGDRTVVA
jgi:GGDEF domain-containing protein